MRIVVIDTDNGFTGSLVNRCKAASVSCEVFPKAAAAFAEIKKNPDSVDIVLISKDLAGDEGLNFAQQLRKDAATSDVPYIIVSSVWMKADFAKHQKTPAGANAYFNKKSALAELEATIEAVTGFKFTTASEKTGMSGILNIKLEAANDVVNMSESVPDGISTEVPINLFPDGEPAEAAPPPVQSAPPKVEASNVSIAMPSLEVPSMSIDVATPSISIQTQTAAPVKTTESASIMIELSPNTMMVSSPSQEGAFEKTSVSTAPPSKSAASTNGTGINIQMDDGNLQIESSSGSAVTSGSVEMPSINSDSIHIEQSIDLGMDSPATSTKLAPTNPIAEMPIMDFSAPATQVVTPEAPVAASPSTVSEEEAAKDLPYLFTDPAQHTLSTRGVAPQSSVASGLPNVDVQMGGPLSNDVDTLKKYLTMREQDVSVLSAQLTYAKEELSKYDDTVKRLSLQNEDLGHQINDLKERVSKQDQELQHAGKSMEGEVEGLRFEVKSKIDRIKFLEDRLNDSADQYEKLKERVRLDIRKIRVREKELESKLEILKKDSETLIAGRENKILELKRKIDLLEFNYDTLQDKNENERQNVVRSKEKLERVHKVLKLALGVIEADDDETSPSPSRDQAA